MLVRVCVRGLQLSGGLCLLVLTCLQRAPPRAPPCHTHFTEPTGARGELSVTSPVPPSLLLLARPGCSSIRSFWSSLSRLAASVWHGRKRGGGCGPRQVIRASPYRFNHLVRRSQSPHLLAAAPALEQCPPDLTLVVPPGIGTHHGIQSTNRSSSNYYFLTSIWKMRKGKQGSCHHFYFTL